MVLSMAADSSGEIFRFSVTAGIPSLFTPLTSWGGPSLDLEELLLSLLVGEPPRAWWLLSRLVLTKEGRSSELLPFELEELLPETAGGRFEGGLSCPPEPPSLSDPLLLSFGKLNPKLLFPMLTSAELSDALLSLQLLPLSLLLDVPLRLRFGFIDAKGFPCDTGGIGGSRDEVIASLLVSSVVPSVVLSPDMTDDLRSRWGEKG
jgi:hypothetical protein